MIRINLLPVKYTRHQEAVRRELILATLGGVALVALLAVISLALMGQVNAARAENARLKAELAREQELVAEVDQAEKLKAELQKKLHVIRKLKASKTGPVRMLDELSLATPGRLYLKSLDEKQNKVELTGIAVSNEIISQFLSNLEQSHYFTDVYLNSIDQVEIDKVKLKNFSITARLVPTGATASSDASPEEKE